MTAMKIALIQQHAGPDRAANFELGVRHLRQAARQGSRLAVFAELAFDRFFPQFRRQEGQLPAAETVPGPTTELFCRLAKELEMVIVLNLFEREGDNTFDSSPVIDSDGTLLGTCRMVHIMQGPCFYERDYYCPGDHGATVFSTAAGELGVAICYDRHYPEYMRSLALEGAQLVVVPQAGAEDEWPQGIFEAELQVAAFQNGYFAALANRVGREDSLTFAGESFVVDPLGRVISRAPRGRDHILYAELDYDLLKDCPAARHFLPDRRPEAYPLDRGAEVPPAPKAGQGQAGQ